MLATVDHNTGRRGDHQRQVVRREAVRAQLLRFLDGERGLRILAFWSMDEDTIGPDRYAPAIVGHLGKS
jgi:hypothetical protein